ncbi:helicase associated domain-containing protein [Streptomyces viridiviolaceus]|uniref:Helicase associated domain-containing protein n=1 Tax=Streptomyces viridiviolaceus TaxID=68282 RepID=A0ABW2EFE1_9ACTN|nr:helicase associated domain-containing protein [Streptomyces viridiviolaceus]
MRRATDLAAARQFHAREGHLRVPRKHVEHVGGEPVRLGSFPDNSRRRAARLGEQRRTDLDALGMRRQQLLDDAGPALGFQGPSGPCAWVPVERIPLACS